MSKENLQQANFRLPEQLLEDLRKVAQIDPESQSEIARKGIAKEVTKRKKKYQIEETSSIITA